MSIKNTWQAKPDKEGYYLMRSGDSSAWTASSIVEVYNSQSYLSMTVQFVGTNRITCVDDYCEYVDWSFIGTNSESIGEITEDEIDKLVMLPKVKMRERREVSEKMKKHARNHPLIKAWRKFSIKEGGCIQCQNPWYDGMCDCDFSKKYQNLYESIEGLAILLHEDGWEL